MSGDQREALRDVADKSICVNCGKAISYVSDRSDSIREMPSVDWRPYWTHDDERISCGTVAYPVAEPSPLSDEDIAAILEVLGMERKTCRHCRGRGRQGSGLWDDDCGCCNSHGFTFALDATHSTEGGAGRG